MGVIEQIRAEMFSLQNKEKAQISKRYLKSQYDFYGIPVPQLRKIAKQYKDYSKQQVYALFEELWNSDNHEEMSLALYLLGNLKKQFSLETWDFLMHNFNSRPAKIEKAKSWDHIDEISSHITGEILLNFPTLQSEIKSLSTSKNPWLRRLSIVSQYPCIKKGKIQLTLLLAEKLVYDEDIYVQKGAGWMLREAAKKNPVQVSEFIKIHKGMKAAAFSYATEKMLHLRTILKDDRKEAKDKLKIKEKDENNTQNLDKIKYFKN
jgi:3-methyladenine DNA glycosylase AlkD